MSVEMIGEYKSVIGGIHVSIYSAKSKLFMKIVGGSYTPYSNPVVREVEYHLNALWLDGVKVFENSDDALYVNPYLLDGAHIVIKEKK